MSNFIYPKFQTFEQFELLVNEIFKRKTQNINFQIYWRKWQKQYWIDWYWFDYINNSFIVTQCKNFTNEKKWINKTKLINALQEFDKKELPFYNDIETFYYVTAENRDKDFSNIEIEYNKLREEKSLPKVKIFTWDDLCDEIENHQDLLYKFFLKHIPLGKIKNINYDFKPIDNTTILKFWESISDEQIELFKNSFIEKINIEKTFNNKEDNESTLILWLDWWYKKNLSWETDLNFDFSKIYTEDSNWLEDFLNIIIKIY